MTGKNKYVKGAHVSGCKFRELLRLFSVDLNASQIVFLTGLSRNTVNLYLRAIRIRLQGVFSSRFPFSGEVEADESLFGARLVKSKRGRGVYGKTIGFDFFKRIDGMYTEIVSNYSKATL